MDILKAEFETKVLRLDVLKMKISSIEQHVCNRFFCLAFLVTSSADSSV